MQAEGLPAILNLTEYFVGQDDGNGQFECMHGDSECQGNIIELCAYNLTVTTSKYGWWTMGVCMQADYDNIPDNAASCAQQASLDWSQIQACWHGELGPKLFSESIVFSNSMNIQATPDIYIDGTEYLGGPDNNLQTVCQAYTGPPPAGCNQLKAMNQDKAHAKVDKAAKRKGKR